MSLRDVVWGGEILAISQSVVGVAAVQPTPSGPANSLAEQLGGLSTVETAGIVFGTIVFLGGALVLMFDVYVDTLTQGARRNPVKTFFLGIFGQMSFLGLFGALLFSFVLVLFIFPFVFIYVAWSVLGFVTVGEMVARKVGWTSSAAGVFVAAVIGTGLAFVPVVSWAGLLVFSTFGIGAGLGTRVMFSRPSRGERNVHERRL